MQYNKALIIFIKNAVAGKVKTRLAKSIGNHAALKVYKNLLDITRSACSLVNANRYLYYSEKVEESDTWSIALFEKKLQEGEDLGERMKKAFQECFENENEKVIIVGSDCPNISAEIIENAFEKLDQHDVVIGPAKDGGYYLLAMRKLHNAIFDDKQWSTEGLLKQTLKSIEDNKLKYCLLEELYDVDTIEDLKLFDT